MDKNVVKKVIELYKDALWDYYEIDVNEDKYFSSNELLRFYDGKVSALKVVLRMMGVSDEEIEKIDREIEREVVDTVYEVVKAEEY